MMAVPGRRMLVVYEAEPPGPLLLACLAQYDADFVPLQKFDSELGPPYLRIYDALLVYTPGSLLRGRSFCDSLRRLVAAPILLIAPNKPPDAACRALQASVDILLPPETEPAIVAGHVAALLRCQQRHGPAAQALSGAVLHQYEDEHLEIDMDRRTVKVQGEVIHLTPTEFRFLALLARHAHELLTYDEILKGVWGWAGADHRIVHTFAAQLRAKLGACGRDYLVNEYSTGYRFSPP